MRGVINLILLLVIHILSVRGVVRWTLVIHIFNVSWVFMQVTSPAGNVVHTLKGTSGDKFEFKAPQSGMYKFCFHNPYSTPETVSFYIHVGHIPNEHNLAKDGWF